MDNLDELYQKANAFPLRTLMGLKGSIVVMMFSMHPSTETGDLEILKKSEIYVRKVFFSLENSYLCKRI